MSNTAKNDITGDLIKTKTPSKAYEDNYDTIFRNKQPVQLEPDLGGTEVSSSEPMVSTNTY